MELTGIAQAIVKNISVLAGQNDPQVKVRPSGFLKALMANNAMTQINNLPELQAGHDRTVKVRYMQRGIASEVSHTDDCDTPLSAAWKETDITHTLFSKVGLFISDADMRQYETAATQADANGVMKGLSELLISKAAGLVADIDQQLLSAQATKWGANAAYSLATTAQTINFGATAELGDGFIKLMTDMQQNEVADDLIIVGNGAVMANDALMKYKTGYDSVGVSAMPLNAYYDASSVSKWGANHFGVFAKGNVGLVDWNKNVGAFAGEKGGSVFFTIPVPVELDNGELTALTLDAQLKYVDCPTFDSEGTQTAGRGWKLILSKNYGLFNAPSDSFGTGDDLAGVNGSFHYIGALK